MKFIKEKVRPKILLIQNITVFFALILFAALAVAGESALTQKRTLKNNNLEVYNILPEPAGSIPQIFTQGIFYGRLRLNYFYWENEDGRLHDPTGFGLGGSIIYKTAPLRGISGTAGFYTSQNFGLLNKEDALFGRPGKDTFSRYDRLAEGDWGMTVLAQAYLQYSFYKTDIKVGRQIFESFLTASNDTKMIPNTFEGYTLVSKDIPKTTASLAFLTDQKLRDHTTFHDVITYGDGKTRTIQVGSQTFNLSRWNNQDDSACHRGLSYENLKNAGEDVDNDLAIAGLSNETIENLKLDMWYTGVPDLFYSLMAESNYKIPLAGGWSLTPGLRYMQQFDDGAGNVGGASLTGKLAGISGASAGYDDADSVDGKLYGVRLVLEKGAGRLLAGFSKTSDDADLICPWRGFPTSGYTRTMGEYNWFANSESWMIQAYYDFGKAGIIKGFRTSVDCVYTDEDEDKKQMGELLLSTDRLILHADLWYIFPSLPALEAKVRLKFVDADRLTLANNADPSYSEFRFEMNYLF